MPDELRLTTRIAAPPALVWGSRRKRGEWWADLELDARRRDRLLERWRAEDGRDVFTRGEVLEARAPLLLRSTWQDDLWDAPTEVGADASSLAPALDGGLAPPVGLKPPRRRPGPSYVPPITPAGGCTWTT